MLAAENIHCCVVHVFNHKLFVQIFIFQNRKLFYCNGFLKTCYDNKMI